MSIDECRLWCLEGLERKVFILGWSFHLKLIEKFPKNNGDFDFFPLLLNYGRTKAHVLGEHPIKHQIREYNFIIPLIKLVLIVNFKLLRDLAGPLLALVFKMNRLLSINILPQEPLLSTVLSILQVTLTIQQKKIVYICSSAGRNLLYL